MAEIRLNTASVLTDKFTEIESSVENLKTETTKEFIEIEDTIAHLNVKNNLTSGRIYALDYQLGHNTEALEEKIRDLKKELVDFKAEARFCIAAYAFITILEVLHGAGIF